MAKPKITVINTSVDNEEQSWNYSRIVNAGGHKLRVKIRRNAYDFQSWAKVERWDGTKWQIIETLPITNCVCARVSYVDRGVTADAFESDYEKLMKIALDVVG